METKTETPHREKEGLPQKRKFPLSARIASGLVSKFAALPDKPVSCQGVRKGGRKKEEEERGA